MLSLRQNIIDIDPIIRIGWMTAVRNELLSVLRALMVLTCDMECEYEKEGSDMDSIDRMLSQHRDKLPGNSRMVHY